MPARTLWWGPPRRKSQTVTQRWPPTGRSCREGPLRKGSPEISQSFLLSTGQRFRSASRNFLRSVLRSGKILMQNCATLRNAMRKRNYELPSVSNDMQSSETLRNSLGLNLQISRSNQLSYVGKMRRTLTHIADWNKLPKLQA